MAECRLCRSVSADIAHELGVCLRCVRENPERAIPIAMEAHARSREAFGLPVVPPKDPRGIPCSLCVNACRIPENGFGYCGLRRNDGGRLVEVTAEEGALSWYHDPLPTNCVADRVCAGGTGAGYPEYAYRPGPEYGYRNLAVFFHACSLNCLYCQNWQFKKETLRNARVHVRELISDVDARTSCICFFGGDPTPQAPFALEASRRALAASKERILRICWETNGTMHPGLLDEMAELSLRTGGCIKFDLKAWDENLHIALTGGTNRRTFDNFARVAHAQKTRPVPPLLVANTLLVPGYIDETEIRNIARFVASLDPSIPYSMLAFYPHFSLSDLLFTKRSFAQRCLAAAREEGLRNVRIGNTHLLV